MTAGTEAITEVLVGGAGPAGLTTALLLVPLCHWTVSTSLGSVRGAQARLTAMSNPDGPRARSRAASGRAVDALDQGRRTRRVI